MSPTHTTLTLPYGGPADHARAYTVPDEWVSRVVDLAPCLVFGPGFRRAVAYALERMDQGVRAGYSTAAYDHLLAAERAAK